MSEEKNSKPVDHLIKCPICGEVTEQPYYNYGAKACYSCRQFFRRALQKSRNPSFVCKNSGQDRCVVTVKNRRQCQKCRYDLCLKAGMKPEFVMSDDQKKERFKNVTSGMGRRRRKRLHPRETDEESHNSKTFLSSSSESNEILNGYNENNPWSWLTGEILNFNDVSARNNYSDSIANDGGQEHPETAFPPFIQFSHVDSTQSDPLPINHSPVYPTFKSSPPPDNLPISNVDNLPISSADLPENDLSFLQSVLDDVDFGAIFDEEDSKNDSSSLSLPNRFDLNFSELEDVWYLEQANKFKERYLTVSFGEDFIREFVMYTFDVPLSKKFVPIVARTNAQRYNRAVDVFKPVFKAGEHVPTSNIYRAVALNIAKICNCRTGRCQLRFIVGSQDDEMFKQKFEQVIDVSKLKKIKMSDINAQVQLFSPQTLNNYINLVEHLCFAVRDREIFELFTLVVLFAPQIQDGLDRGNNTEGMYSLYKGYLRLLQHRLRDKMSEIDLNEDEMMDCNEDCTECFLGGLSDKDFPKFSGCLKEVNALADIMEGLAV